MTVPESPEDPNEAAFYRVVRYFLVTPVSRQDPGDTGAAPKTDDKGDPSCRD